MKRICEKLKSSRGASILFAILVFMLCILAGTSALTAASANAGRYTHLEEDQRKYLSVASAIKMFKSEFAGKTFEASFTHTKTESWYWKTGDDGTKVLNETEKENLTTTEETEGGVVHKFVNEYLEQYFISMIPGAFTDPDEPAPVMPETRLKISGNGKLADALTDVYVTLEIDAVSGDLIFTFSSGGDTDGGAYVSTLRIPAEKEPEMSTPDVKVVVEGTDEKGSRTVTTTATFKIEWKSDAVVTRVSD